MASESTGSGAGTGGGDAGGDAPRRSSRRGLDVTERVNLTLSAGAVAASFAVAGPHFASSLALGAVLEAVNFRGLHRTAQSLFAGELQGGGPWVAVLWVRFIALTLGIGAALWFGADPLGLVLGLSVVLPAVVIGSIWNRPPVVDPATLESLPPDDPSWDTYSIWRFREVERDTEDDDA